MKFAIRYMLLYLLVLNHPSYGQVKKTSGDLLLKRAQSQLLAQLGSEYSRIEVRALSHPKDSEYALEDFKIEMQTSFPSAKRVCVWLTHNKQRIAVWFSVHAYADVLIAKRNLSPNTQIKNEAFSLQERDISGLNDKPYQLFPKNKWLKTAIKKDQILLQKQTKEQALVINGETVKLSFQNKAIKLTLDVLAQADGSLGQTIRVKNPANQQVFKAKITGFQQAEVNS